MLNIKKFIGSNALVLLIILIVVASIIIYIVMKKGKKYEVNSNKIDVDASDFTMNTLYDMVQQQTDLEIKEINEHNQQVNE